MGLETAYSICTWMSCKVSEVLLTAQIIFLSELLHLLCVLRTMLDTVGASVLSLHAQH